MASTHKTFAGKGAASKAAPKAREKEEYLTYKRLNWKQDVAYGDQYVNSGGQKRASILYNRKDKSKPTPQRPTIASFKKKAHFGKQVDFRFNKDNPKQWPWSVTLEVRDPEEAKWYEDVQEDIIQNAVDKTDNYFDGDKEAKIRKAFTPFFHKAGPKKVKDPKTGVERTVMVPATIRVLLPHDPESYNTKNDWKNQEDLRSEIPIWKTDGTEGDLCDIKPDCVMDIVHQFQFYWFKDGFGVKLKAKIVRNLEEYVPEGPPEKPTPNDFPADDDELPESKGLSALTAPPHAPPALSSTMDISPDPLPAPAPTEDPDADQPQSGSEIGDRKRKRLESEESPIYR